MTRPLTDGTSAEEIPEEIRTVERLRELREHVITHTGGPEAVGAIHAAGRRTAREHIAEFTDPGSFGEIGAFATFVDKVTAPDPGPYGGGIIGGHATLDGRPVTVATDDDSVTAPSARSTGKAARLYQMALQQRHPYIEIAQGHTVPDQVTMEELGGVDVHRHNGQADTIAETLDEVYAAIRRFLSFLPSAAGAPLPVSDHVPADDRRKIRCGTGQATAARPLIDALCDRGSFFELRQDFAPGLVTGLARLGGIPVGVLASDPATDDGAYTADACLKATRLICTCDAFGLPLVFGVNSPGPRPEPGSAISRAMMLAQAVQLAEVPKCWVITGRARGAGLLVTGPARIATDLVIAWPGFYDDESAGPDDHHWAADGVVTPEGTRDLK